MEPSVRRTLAALLMTLPLLAAGPKPKVKVTSSMGAFVVELEPDAAPKTVENFLQYVRKGHYDGTIFHRVKSDFMIQGGTYLPDWKRKPRASSITNEADLAKAKGLTNKRGTIAMALPVGNPFGATDQFFINVKDNPNLNFKAKNQVDYGYCVFGKVIQGMDVVDKIKVVKTKNVVQGGDKFECVPVKPVLIVKAEELK
jgi:cyclophilin family peptidyl-prolyl cis-trans isomerase